MIFEESWKQQFILLEITQGYQFRKSLNLSNDQVFRATLNVCFAYTSQHEITRAVQEITAAVRAGSIQPK